LNDFINLGRVIDKERVLVKCDTKAEVQLLFDEADNLGLLWSSGDSYKNTFGWLRCNPDIHYVFSYTNGGTFVNRSTIGVAYEVISFKDLLKNVEIVII